MCSLSYLCSSMIEIQHGAIHSHHPSTKLPRPISFRLYRLHSHSSSRGQSSISTRRILSINPRRPLINSGPEVNSMRFVYLVRSARGLHSRVCSRPMSATAQRNLASTMWTSPSNSIFYRSITQHIRCTCVLELLP